MRKSIGRWRLPLLVLAFRPGHRQVILGMLLDQIGRMGLYPVCTSVYPLMVVPSPCDQPTSPVAQALSPLDLLASAADSMLSPVDLVVSLPDRTVSPADQDTSPVDLVVSPAD